MVMVSVLVFSCFVVYVFYNYLGFVCRVLVFIRSKEYLSFDELCWISC